MSSSIKETGNPISANKYLVLFGILLVSFSGLMLEIIITRIFSTTIWYHYAFIAVSVALFGWGFGGVFTHFLGMKKYFLDIVTSATLLFSISIPLCLFIILQLPMSPSALILYYVVSMIPFFLGGVCVSFLFQNLGKTAHILYFADMAGASLGCLFVEPALTTFRAETAVLLIGVIAAIAGILFALASQKRKLIAFGFVALIVSSSVFMNNVQNFSISIRNAPCKSLFQELQSNPAYRDVFTAWNSFSRIDVVEGEPPPVLAHIFIDADAGTNVLRWNGNLGDAEFLKHMIYYGPYNIVNKPAKTLIIGSGGGFDIVTALAGGSSKVVAVEINPIIVEVVKNYGQLTGNVYDYDGVQTVLDEGRSYVSRSDEKYDVIVLTMVDSWAAISAGGYALVENYLYTMEAFQEYFDHLSDRGVLSMTRFYREIPKLVTTAVAVLQSRGIPPSEAAKHIAVTTWEYEPGRVIALFMLKKTPFSPEQADIIRSKTLEMGSNNTLFYVPYFYVQEPYSLLFNGTISLEDFYSLSTKRIRPATDDSPYFFCFEKSLPQNLSTLTIFAVIAVLGVSAIPLMRKRATTRAAQAVPFVVYFGALGAAYMLLEIALIQKFLLFLGYPTRALSVILFTLLLSSGLGSFTGGFIKKNDLSKRVLIVCAFIIVIAITYSFILKPLFALMLPQDAMVRIATAFLLIFPLGFFMGMPFPAGISFLSSSSTKISIPWVWAVNGATSVLGSVLATTIGIMIGVNYAIIVAVVCYFLALLCALRWKYVVSSQQLMA